MSTGGRPAGSMDVTVGLLRRVSPSPPARCSPPDAWHCVAGGHAGR